jgi:hypothetical protein
MNAYQKSNELGLSGTDAEIVAVLQTLTAGKIDPTDVRRWLRENGLWYRRPDGSMGGTLQTVYTAATAQQKTGLDQFFAAVFGDSAISLRTTEPVYAGQVWQIVQVIASLSPEAAGLVDSFYALDGGRPFRDLTVEAYAQQKSDAARTSAADAWAAAALNETIQPAMSNPARTIDTVKAAFLAAATVTQ